MSYLFKHSNPKRHKVLCSSCPSKINRLLNYYSLYWKEVFLKALILTSVILSGIVSHVTSKGTLLWRVLLQWRILRRKFLYTSMYVSIWIFWKWLLQKLVFFYIYFELEFKFHCRCDRHFVYMYKFIIGIARNPMHWSLIYVCCNHDIEEMNLILKLCFTPSLKYILRL